MLHTITYRLVFLLLATGMLFACTTDRTDELVPSDGNGQVGGVHYIRLNVNCMAEVNTDVEQNVTRAWSQDSKPSAESWLDVRNTTIETGTEFGIFAIPESIFMQLFNGATTLDRSVVSSSDLSYAEHMANYHMKLQEDGILHDCESGQSGMIFPKGGGRVAIVAYAPYRSGLTLDDLFNGFNYAVAEDQSLLDAYKQTDLIVGRYSASGKNNSTTMSKYLISYDEEDPESNVFTINMRHALTRVNFRLSMPENWCVFVETPEMESTGYSVKLTKLDIDLKSVPVNTRISGYNIVRGGNFAYSGSAKQDIKALTNFEKRYNLANNNEEPWIEVSALLPGGVNSVNIHYDGCVDRIHTYLVGDNVKNERKYYQYFNITGGFSYVKKSGSSTENLKSGYYYNSLYRIPNDSEHMIETDSDYKPINTVNPSI